MTVFTLSWQLLIWDILKRLLLMQLFAVLFLPFIPISALIADKIGRENVVYVTIAIGFLDFSSYLNSVTVWLLSATGTGLMGFTYGPLGYILIGIISYYGAVFRCVINV
jgi:hypothetical protein